MGVRRGCCEKDCTLWEDKFDRDDAITPGGDWTVVSGTWLINRLSLYTESADAELDCDYTVPNTPTVGWAQTAVGNTGVDDATAGGAFTGGGTLAILVRIVAGDPTSPNTFDWEDSAGNQMSAVAITGAAQTLSSGVTITFAATTGHDVGDYWIIYAWNIQYVVSVDLYGRGERDQLCMYVDDGNCKIVYEAAVLPCENDSPDTWNPGRLRMYLKEGENYVLRGSTSVSATRNSVYPAIADEDNTGVAEHVESSMVTGNWPLCTPCEYVIEIDAVNVVVLEQYRDTFRWSDDGGATWEATDVLVGGNGLVQSLNNNVGISFWYRTGHIVGDRWTFEGWPFQWHTLQVSVSRVVTDVDPLRSRDYIIASIDGDVVPPCDWLAVEAAVTSSNISLGTGDLSALQGKIHAMFDDFDIEKHRNEQDNCPYAMPPCCYFYSPASSDDATVNAYDWTGAVGTWTVDGMDLVATSSNAGLWSLCLHPADVARLSYDVTMSAATDGDVTLVYFNDTDYVRFLWRSLPNVGTVGVYVDGVLVPPEQSMTLTPGLDIDVNICLARRIVTVSGGDIPSSGMSRQSDNTNQVIGIGTQNLVSSEARFSVRVQRTSYTLTGCPTCLMECDQCVDGIMAGVVVATLEGMEPTVGTGDPCLPCTDADCNNLDGDWFLEYAALIMDTANAGCSLTPGSALDLCSWGYEEERDEWCGESGTGLRYLIRFRAFPEVDTFVTPNEYWWHAILTITKCNYESYVGQYGVEWDSVHTTAGELDCMSLDADLTFTLQACPGTWIPSCDASNSTIRLRSI